MSVGNVAMLHELKTECDMWMGVGVAMLCQVVLEHRTQVLIGFRGHGHGGESV